MHKKKCDVFCFSLGRSLSLSYFCLIGGCCVLLPPQNPVGNGLWQISRLANRFFIRSNFGCQKEKWQNVVKMNLNDQKKNEPTKWHHSKCVSFLTKICSIDFDLFAYIRICICTQHTVKALPQRHAYAWKRRQQQIAAFEAVLKKFNHEGGVYMCA